jgi:ribosomal protein S4E
MHKYRIYYLADHDDGDPTTYESSIPVSPGDVIQLPETGDFHQAIRLLQQKTGTRLDLSKSAQSEAEARLLSVQYGFWPAG